LLLQFRRIELEQEREKSRVLQESLHVLAQEHLDLERSITTVANFRPPSVLSGLSRPHGATSIAGVEADEFFECESDGNLKLCIALCNDFACLVHLFLQHVSASYSLLEMVCWIKAVKDGDVQWVLYVAGSLSDFGSVTSGDHQNNLNSTVATFSELQENDDDVCRLSPKSNNKVNDLGTSVWGGR
jgi:hypothetical protein